MNNNELTSLVRRSQKGETKALEELLRVSYTPVSYQCRRFLKTGQDAEDMTQEVLLLLYTKLDTLQEPAAFWGWLGRMTANRCKNALVRTHAELPILEDEEGNSVLDVMENADRQTRPEEAFDNAETAHLIGGIVDALPDAQRQCVLLYYYDEMSVKEIASLLGTSENTVKSRLNYARKAIKENVLDYEKKNGIRLHSLAPLPLLLYFLRWSAEDATDQAAAKKMATKVMEQGAAAGGSAMSTAAASGQTALHTVSMKTIGIAAAGLVAVGGVTAGIVALVNHDQTEPVSSAAIVEEASPALTGQAETEAAEAEAAGEIEAILTGQETALLYPEAMLASLPYTGDTGQCAMTMEQAQAFADALDGCIAQSEAAGYSEPPFCQAALFDAGDGVPALFVTWGYDMGYGSADGYMPGTSQIYCWDGETAQVAYESHPQAEYFDEDIADITVTANGLLVCRDVWEDSVKASVSAVYAPTGGMLGEAPAHVYEDFIFTPYELPSEDTYRSAIESAGQYGDGYDYDALTEDKWQFYPEYSDLEGIGRWWEEGGYVLSALDGRFLTPEEAAAARKDYAWYGADWILGHGSKWNTDVSHYWTGNWMDAKELAALLRGGASAAEETVPPETEEAFVPATEEIPPEAEEAFAPATEGILPAAEETAGDIRRTTIDSRGYDIEIYYETPALAQSGEGYQKINAAFADVPEYFTQDALADMWEIVEGNPPQSDHYYYTLRTDITARTDRYVCIAQTFDSYLGGIKGSETQYYNFRTDTGEALLLTDVIDDTEDGIKTTIAHAVAQYDPYTEETGALDDIRGRALEAFAFTIREGHAYVCFSSYDLYQMAYGAGESIEIELPVELKE